MSLPPLANLLAVHRDDPAVLDDIAIDLEASGEFAHVWRPARGWVAAEAPLPGGEPDSAAVRANGLIFAEGRDLVEGRWRAKLSEQLAAVAELADRRPENLSSISGDFGFIRFRLDGTATAVRSCGGLVPFYVWQSGRDLAVSTRLGDLVRYLPETPNLDALVNGIWTTAHGLFPDQRTFLSGVKILDRGHSASLNPTRPVAYQRYWQPRVSWMARPSATQVLEHTDRLRTLLVNKLRRDLDPEGGNLLTLSGGVDSSCLAALATQAAKRPVWTWSLLPGPEHLFQREMSYIEPLVSAFGIDRTWSYRMWNATATIDLLPKAPRVVFHVIHPALCALPAVVREAPVRVLFGGEFADEACGSGATTPDWAAHTSLLRLVTGVGRLPSGPMDLLRWAKHRALEAVQHPKLPFAPALGDFVRPEINAEYRTWLERRRRDAAQDTQDRRYLALCSEASGFVAMNWEAASALGVRRSFPFFHREVLELAFECHPFELVGPGSKKLLKAALVKDVPAKNLYRPDKGGWGAGLRTSQVEWQESLPDALGAVVKDDWLPTPPSQLSPSAARGLRQLVMFEHALMSRRIARLNASKENRARPVPSGV